MRAALVTDSNSQIPDELRDRFAVRVVPIPMVVNDVPFLEGVDIDADRFYRFFAAGVPTVTTSQPSPGEFVDIYQLCVDAGHDTIISVHIAKSMSGTINSARIAAEMVDADVHIVDSRTASFGVSCCVWRAGEILQAGGSPTEAVAAAESLADQLYSVTALGAADLLNASGRISIDASTDGIDVLRAEPGGGFASVGVGKSIDEVCDLMAVTMHCDGAPIHVALGVADETAAPYVRGLEERLARRIDVVESVRYRIGPSVGAFTGLGTAGGFWYPANI